MPDRIMIIVAGGSSVRFGADKMMADIGGRPLVGHTVRAVLEHVDQCILVCREDQMQTLAELDLDVALVPGGPTRTTSEMSGLAAVETTSALIGIHDGARPLVPPALIDLLYDTAARVGGAVPVSPPSRLLIHKSDLSPASGLVVAQTPQVFQGEQLLAAYVKAARIEYEAQDTAEIVQRFSRLGIEAVPGSPENLKVTFPEDLERVRDLLDVSHNDVR
ncbi:MAG: 2-C-methyl-D-erythritol 4-phosphate cytidylyltransferase [Acidimicrobiia bacterium]